MNKILTCDSLGETSKKLYHSRLKSWIEILGPGKTTLEFLINNPENSCKILRETIKTPSVATLHTYFSAVVAFLQHCTDKSEYSKELKEKWRKIQGENWEQRPKYDGTPINEKQVAVSNKLTWADIIKKRDELAGATGGGGGGGGGGIGSPEHLLLSMYTFLPPLRADYYCVELVSPDEKPMTTCNYLVIDDKEKRMDLHIGDFKTSKKYGEIRHEINHKHPLYQIIKESLRKIPRKFLFTMPSKSGEPFDRHGFTVWTSNILRRLFPGIPISLTDLRHLHNSTIDYTHMPANKLEELGKSMGHSMEMQKKYQWISK